MRKLLASLIVVMFVGLLVPSASAQAVEDPAANFDEKQYVINQDDPRGTRFRMKYPFEKGPDDPNDNPWVITEPLYPERRGSNVNTSVASSQGLTSGATGAPMVAPNNMNGPGAILSGRGSSARSSHQDARRGVKKAIRDLG